jgi:hypothetical protein
MTLGGPVSGCVASWVACGFVHAQLAMRCLGLGSHFDVAFDVKHICNTLRALCAV